MHPRLQTVAGIGLALGIAGTLVYGMDSPHEPEVDPVVEVVADTAGAHSFAPARVRPVAPSELALAALSDDVAALSHPDALRMAFEAYYAFKAKHPKKVRKPYLYFVDYGLDNRTPRGYVFDMERRTLVEGPFTVAHGRGSLRGDGVPKRFSNVTNSYTSSLGLYLAAETYGFSGTASGRRYRSIGLRMEGLSEKFNSRARERGVVAHGAPYVTAKRAGRSEGCPAMEESRARRLLPMLSQGGMVFLYSPHDTAWLRDDPWGGSANRPRLAIGR